MTWRGYILDEWGDVVGKFWYRPSMMAYALRWHKHQRDGYTLDGIRKWADSLGYQVDEIYEY